LIGATFFVNAVSVSRPGGPRIHFKMARVRNDVKGMSKEKQTALERWHQREGKAEPKRRTGAPDGNTNRMTHGIFANRCLDEEERVLFREVIDRLYSDFEFNRSSDFLQIEFIGINTVKYMRAMAEGNLEAAQKLDQMIRANMKDVKATKISREGDQPQAPQTTPADWASDLLKKSDEESEDVKPRKKAMPKKRKKDGG